MPAAPRSRSCCGAARRAPATKNSSSHSATGPRRGARGTPRGSTQGGEDLHGVAAWLVGRSETTRPSTSSTIRSQRREPRVVGHQQEGGAGPRFTSCSRSKTRRRSWCRGSRWARPRARAGVHRERPRDRDALLAAGEMDGRVVATAVSPTFSSSSFRTAAFPRPAGPGRRYRHQDVLQGGERGQQVVELEDETDAVAAQAGERAVVEEPLVSCPSMMKSLPPVGGPAIRSR